MNKFYFQHDQNASEDPKIISLRIELGWEGYGVYWGIIELLHKNNGYMDYSDKRIAFALQAKVEVVKRVCEEFSLFSTKEGKLFSRRLLKQIEHRSNIVEKRRRAGSKGGRPKDSEKASEKHLLEEEEPIEKQTESKNNPKKSKVKKSKVKESREENTEVVITSAKSSKISSNTNSGIEKRQSDFIESLKPFSEKYGKDMLREFLLYWSEPNKSKSKMRFEMEKTWSLARRLERWASNNFGKKNGPQPVVKSVSSNSSTAQRILQEEAEWERKKNSAE